MSMGIIGFVRPLTWCEEILKNWDTIIVPPKKEKGGNK